MADKFTEALKKRKQDQAMQDRGGNYERPDYENPEYFAMEIDKCSVFRIYGLPMRIRENPWDAKRVAVSWVVNDSGGNCRIVWPNKATNPNWILYRIYNTVMAYDWDSTTKSKKYKYVDTHPDIFARMFNNSNPKVKFENGWKPQVSVVFNAIDRIGYDWHKENKKFKLFSSKVSSSNKNPERKYYRDGVTPSFYDLIMDEVVEYNGDWKAYDLVSTKLMSDPYYKVYHPTDDKKKLDKDFPKAWDYITEADNFTEEEASWKPYNLDNLFKVSTYSKILKNFGTYIKQIDSAFNKNFYDELVDLSNKEKEEWAEKYGKKDNVQKVSKPKKTEEIEDEIEKEVLEEKKVEKPVKRRSTQKSVESTFDVSTLDKSVYKGIDKMTDEQISWIKGIDDDGNILFVEKDKNGNVIDMAEDGDGKLTPLSLTHCPYSGEEYPEIE